MKKPIFIAIVLLVAALSFYAQEPSRLGGRGMAFTGAMATAEVAGAEAARHTPFVRDSPKVKPNEPCYCGSGRKYKKCHGAGV